MFGWNLTAKMQWVFRRAMTHLLSGLALCSGLNRLAAQIPPSIQIDTSGQNPSLVIDGQTGVIHVIQCSESLSTNAVWRTLSYSTLSNSSWVWQDQTLYGGAARFYQVVGLGNRILIDEKVFGESDDCLRPLPVVR